MSVALPVAARLPDLVQLSIGAEGVTHLGPVNCRGAVNCYGPVTRCGLVICLGSSADGNLCVGSELYTTSCSLSWYRESLRCRELLRSRESLRPRELSRVVR